MTKLLLTFLFLGVFTSAYITPCAAEDLEWCRLPRISNSIPIKSIDLPTVSIDGRDIPVMMRGQGFTVTCTIDTVLKGQKNVTCMGNNTWTTLPICTREPINFRVISNVGYNDFDLSGGALRVASDILCQQHCYEWNHGPVVHSQPCTLWSFYANVPVWDGNNCYLKTNTTAITPAPCPPQQPNCATSGTINTFIDVLVLPGVGYNNFDILPASTGRLRVSSPLACQQACIDLSTKNSASGSTSPICTLWSFYANVPVEDGNNCYLKYNTTAVTPAPTCQPQQPLCATSGTINGCSTGFRVDLNTGSCVLCGNSTYSRGGFSQTCTLCPEGTTSPQGSGSASACIPCPAGTYSNYGTAARGVCIPCEAGTYSATVGSTTPDNCIPCPNGQTSRQGANTCTSSCPAGFYA